MHAFIHTNSSSNIAVVAVIISHNKWLYVSPIEFLATNTHYNKQIFLQITNQRFTSRNIWPLNNTKGHSRLCSSIDFIIIVSHALTPKYFLLSAESVLPKKSALRDYLLQFIILTKPNILYLLISCCNIPRV